MAERIFLRNRHGTDKLHNYTGEFAICKHQTFRRDYVKDDVGRVCSMNEKNVSKNVGTILERIF